MRGTLACFNIVLTLWVLASPVDGAESKKKSKSSKPLKSVRIHLESRHDIAERSLVAVVGRSNPMKFSVEKLPILSESHVENATLRDQPGGFELVLKFDTVGTKLLESYTAAAAGKHFAVMTDIDGDTRWLAAPLIRRRIADGVFAFAPDASREEMDRLVKGLNDEVRKNKSRWLN